MLRTFLAFALALGALALAVACDDEAEAPPPAPEPERVLTILYWQAPSVPNPYLSGGYKDRDAAAVTLEPLASYSPEGELVARLAVEVPTTANGGVAADLTSITWTLRDGLLWSDGSEVTAEDVVFTWRYCTDEATGCTSSDAFSGISSVEAVDARTVRIMFEGPTPYPYNAFVGASTPIISSTQFAGCVGAAAATTCEAQNMTPVGTGPYRLTTFSENEGASYERNPHYRGETPYFDRVVIVGGGTAEQAASTVLERGEADYAWNLQVPPLTLAAMEADGLGTVVTAFAGDTERIVINHTNPDPALGDDRSEYLGGSNPHPFLTFEPITQAMSMAIDRWIIAQELYGFAAAPACNLVPGPARYASTANDGCLTQDIEGAKALLDEHGVVDTDGDGIREYDGVPLRITYQTTTNAIRQDTQTLVHDWWAEIGIETHLVHHDAGVFFGGDPVTDAESTYRRFFADVQMYTTGPGIDPQEYLSSQRCDQIPTRENNWANANIPRWCEPEYDRLYEELAATTDPDARAEVIKRLNDALVQGYAEIPLVLRGFVSAHLNTLQGVRINAWDTELWNIAEWRR
ncbi:MAG: peptide ABC transporter substrate-binding protein [Chloroflexota bacterium]|nr:peptide ABC transporter substrate-binding protein [Chloroflexota bacterium]